VTGRSQDDYEMRQWAAALFSSRAPQRNPDDEPHPLPNHVAREGANSSHVPVRHVGRKASLDWIADLLGTDENARGLDNRDWA
jgi:hypothetical protein